MDPLQHQPGLYIRGQAIEVYPNVYVERGTKLYHKNTLKGKMQDLAFKHASVYVNSIGSVDNLNASIELLRSITYEDSQLFYPAPFGYHTNQEQIANDIINNFRDFYTSASVWFPANGWIFDKQIKYGVVGSAGKKRCYYHFGTEVQFRQMANSGANPNAATNDFWSFFVDQEADRYYQLKEWLDITVARIQGRRTISGQEILIRDIDNINLLPYPPVAPGVDIVNTIIDPITIPPTARTP